mgnify:FL=1
MKNYYDLLEVSEKASPEVIEKAYKTLVKKYHPDLQPDDKKKEAEEKIKEINEAYEILSDKTKKENYDSNLAYQRKKEEQAKYANMNRNTTKNNTNSRSYQNYSQNQNSAGYNDNNSNYTSHPQKRVIHKPKMQDIPPEFDDFNDFQNDYNNIMNEVYNNAYNNAYTNAYNQAYINNLRNMGYDVKFERPLKERIKIFFSSILAIIIFLVICFILWHIPFIKNYFIDLYNTNTIFKIIVDLISNVIKSFFALFN